MFSLPFGTIKIKTKNYWKSYCRLLAIATIKNPQNESMLNNRSDPVHRR